MKKQVGFILNFILLSFIVILISLFVYNKIYSIEGLDGTATGPPTSTSSPSATSFPIISVTLSPTDAKLQSAISRCNDISSNYYTVLLPAINTTQATLTQAISDLSNQAQKAGANTKLSSQITNYTSYTTKNTNFNDVKKYVDDFNAGTLNATIASATYPKVKALYDASYAVLQKLRDLSTNGGPALATATKAVNDIVTSTKYITLSNGLTYALSHYKPSNQLYKDASTNYYKYVNDMNLNEKNIALNKAKQPSINCANAEKEFAPLQKSMDAAKTNLDTANANLAKITSLAYMNPIKTQLTDSVITTASGLRDAISKTTSFDVVDSNTDMAKYNELIDAVTLAIKNYNIALHDAATGKADLDLSIIDVFNRMFDAQMAKPTTPNTTMPNTTVPNTTVPNTTVPNTTRPNPTVANTTKPNPTVANTTKPNPTVANTTKPNPTVANTTRPNPTVANITKPNPTVANITSPNPTVANITSPNPTVANTTKPNPTVANTTKPNPTVANITSPNPTVANTTKPNPTFANTTKPNPTFANTTKPNPTFANTTKPNTTRPNVTPTSAIRTALL
jgi:hypothetical protein